MRDQRGNRLVFKGEFWDGRENKGGFRGGRKEKPCVILQARSSRSRISTGGGEDWRREKAKAW